MAAFEAFEQDPDIHGEAHCLMFAEETAATAPLQGPRQLLLEAAPCAACDQALGATEAKSLICDRCNAPYHLRCTSLHTPPPTYWYCTKCAHHIRSRGYQCPTEDIPLQLYLLTGRAPPHLLPTFQHTTSTYTFTDQLYSWHTNRWVAFPPKGLQLLLMEEAHITNAHVGSEKLYHLLSANWYWPTMRTDCTRFVQHCFECQLSGGRTHGSWMGSLLPLPPGPRITWSIDLITNLGPPDAPKKHLLAAICCYSKFCLLRLIPDRSSTTVASTLKHHLFATFGTPAHVRTDNGKEFAGATAALFAAHNVRHHHTSPYTSHSNGQVERLHRTVESLLRRCLVSAPHSTWE